MHANPVADVWSLVDDPYDYPHSSAAFYERGSQCFAPVTHYHEIIL